MLPTVNIVYKLSILFLMTKGLLCLRNVHVIVPEAAERGSKVVMRCNYDLEQEILYTVKWYRGDREFSRYSPRDVPPLKVFKIPGIDVDKQETDAEQLTIVPKSALTAEGRYICEVSADAPSFQTARVHSHMYVVDLPKEGPEMHGLRRRYKAGSKLKIECISRNSLPAANLSFFINDDYAHSQQILHRVDGTSPEGLMTAYSTIQFVVQKHHFLSGKIRIRCAAIIYSIYIKTIEKVAELENERTTTTEFPEIIRTVTHTRRRLPQKSRSYQPILTIQCRISSLIVLLISTIMR